MLPVANEPDISFKMKFAALSALSVCGLELSCDCFSVSHYLSISTASYSLPLSLLISRLLIHLPCFRPTVSMLWILRLPFSASVSLFLFLSFILTCLPFPPTSLPPSDFPFIFFPISPQPLRARAPLLSRHPPHHHFHPVTTGVFFYLYLSSGLLSHFSCGFLVSSHLFSPPIYPSFFLCNFPSHPTASSPFHPSPTWFHFPSVPSFSILFPTCYCNDDFLASLYLYRPSLPHLHLPFSIPSFISSAAALLSLFLPLFSSSVYHPLISWHFSRSNFVTVSTHQTVFIFLSLGRVIFLIFSSYHISFCHYLPLLLFRFMCTLTYRDEIN